MTPPVRIILGDVRDGLRSLAERSVQCCVTSPPYWGLRDYGTGEWVGGDPSCGHKPSGQSPDPKNPESTARNGKPSATDRMVLSGRCVCGAEKVDRQIGLEATPERFVETMVEVFREVRRVLRDDGTLWLNLGDSYNSGTSAKRSPSATADHGYWTEGEISNRVNCPELKVKDLCMMPWRVAMALQADGWWLRSVICWHKRSPMPESVTDRPTSSWEPIFLMAKSDRYFYDAEAVKEQASRGHCGSRFDVGKTGTNGGPRVQPGEREDNGTRNMRNVWTLSNEPYSEAHFATFPSEIPRRAIRAGTSEKGCCPACGAPWERVVERTRMVIDPSGRDGRIPGNGPRSTSGTMIEPPSQRTTGWTPGCACPPAEPVPCVVLDPFLGSGTTIAAARQLGRHGVGCELNPAYADMARVRIAKAEKPHTFMDHREPAEKGLFA